MQIIFVPILGRLSDRFGRRPILIVSLVGTALGFLIMGWASSLVLLFVARIIDGASGGNISTAQAYISDITTPQNRARGMALIGVAFGIGFSAGPCIGGVLGDINPSYPAYLAAACSAAASIMSMFLLPESHVRGPTQAEAWLHPRSFLPILRKKTLLQLLLISFITMAAFVMMESTVALFLNKTFGYTRRQVGWLFAFWGACIIVVQGVAIGRLTRKWGDWPLAILGPLLVAVGMTGYVVVGYHPVLALLVICGAINSCGRSFQMPTVSSLISKSAEPREQGTVFGLYHGLGSLARVLGPFIAGLTYPFLRNTGAFITAGCIVIAGAAWTLLLRLRTQVLPQAAPAPEALVAET
jgi:DHA1 family tetracycline resistance protein-like MFS transporter